MYHGIINVYKEPGFTSHDVVAKLRGIAGQRKIGHTGTLDPAAEGVLPVCLGKATRVCDLLTDRSKEYIAVMRLGIMTDTEDMTGVILSENPVVCTEEEIRDAVQNFVGDIDQVPPMYSALKVNGKKLYDLARQGIEVERKARRITIHEIEILKIELPLVEFRVSCSKGTYIRTLCKDIGERLGCGAAMEHLTRSRVGEFQVEEALTLAQLQAYKDEGRLEEAICPVDLLFASYPGVRVLPAEERLLLNGNPLRPDQVEFLPGDDAAEKTTVRVYDTKDQFCGLYEMGSDHRIYRPLKMFLGEA